SYYIIFQAEDGIRDRNVTGVQTCALPISAAARQFQVEFFADGKVLQIGAGLEKKGDQYVIHTEEGTRTSREMTEAEKLGVSVVRSEERRVGKECRGGW